MAGFGTNDVVYDLATPSIMLIITNIMASIKLIDNKKNKLRIRLMMSEE